jgi:hypothetical protein
MGVRKDPKTPPHGTKSEAIGTDCIGSIKSNYHTITTPTAPIVSIAQV